MGKPTTIWTYRNEHGRPMGHVARYDIPATETDPADKVIWPWTFGIREGKREWCVGAMPEPRVPFNLDRSEEHTSELQSLMRISYAVFCLKKKKNNSTIQTKLTINI